MTNEELAIQQHLSKPAPQFQACGCLGPSSLPGQPQCDGTNWHQIKWYPVCPCTMQMVEEVDGKFYLITEYRATTGITHHADLLGPVGGPYKV